MTICTGSPSMPGLPLSPSRMKKLLFVHSFSYSYNELSLHIEACPVTLDIKVPLCSDMYIYLKSDYSARTAQINCSLINFTPPHF